MKAKTKKKIYFGFLYTLLLFYFGMSLFGISIFWIGFHNIDLAANHFVVANLLEEQKIILKDYASNDNHITMIEMYRMGMKQIQLSIVILIGSVFLFSTILENVYIEATNARGK